MSTLPVIRIDVQNEGKGKYDAYLAADCSSGAHYEHVTSDQIGKFIAELIDDLAKEYGDTTED